MGSFDDALMNDAPAFLDTFGEAVTYIPRSGSPRNIDAIVDREIPTRVRMLQGMQAVRLLVTVANSVTTGIATSEVNTGGDRVSVSVRHGGTAESLRIVSGEPVSQDAGMVTYALA